MAGTCQFDVSQAGEVEAGQAAAEDKIPCGRADVRVVM